MANIYAFIGKVQNYARNMKKDIKYPMYNIFYITW